MHKTELIRNNQFSPLLFCNVEVLRYLKILGLALITVSLLYLMAANWWMLPDPVQLAIPMLILLCSATASIYFDQQEWVRQSLDTVSGLMLGLSLAMIGQIYQTGADSYQLFLLWALLLLPWLYRPNIGIFALFCVVSQLVLYFYFKQSFWLVRAETLYLLSLNLLTGLSMIYALRYYPVLRYLFIAVVVLISVVSMFRFVDSDSIWYLASVLVLPILFSAYFYTRKQQLETSLLIAGLALSFSILIFDLTEQYLQDSAAGLLVLALLIFSWFAAITGLLIKLLPKSRFSVIPLALGAWIAGVILAMLLLTYWESFSILMGIIFIAVAWWLIRSKPSVFLRQLAYCLWVCGQAAVLIHTQLLTENLLLIWLIQVGITLLTIMSRMHWLVVLLQLLLAHILGIAVLAEQHAFFQDQRLLTWIRLLNYSILTVTLITARYWLASAYAKSVNLWMISVLAATAIFQCLLQFGVAQQLQPHGIDEAIVFYILPAIWLLSFVGIHLKQFSWIQLWLIPAVGILLIVLGYFEIFIILVFMAWAMVNQQRLMQALSILLLIFWLWLLYYNLGLSFLFKSVSIFASGVLVLLLAYVLSSPKFQLKAGVVS
ncbi:DUF2157 domain-containing protein [Acinetobacter lwoffii]|uniref:DUF2157 domain-containing protein n=1 Tax=Acinetobacter lwoffii TaxID=28090 RepID=UPI00110CEFD4|nr:DUF2157 domain-containing protein [Acinetobacter lwoffii]MCU4422362.1 DUF2157 domain-containing protein [Acinetobacter lwoffii]MCU4451183.1 DUF2157 domain-containing protein [Acinetobacter lwoffii]TMS55125.1 DUF2157 domain-containing protein [Acinetobacter lwoffii]